MKFKFYKIDGTCNCEYFHEFDQKEFEAATKSDAYKFVAECQKAGEKAMTDNGKELTPYDPCLYNCVAEFKGVDSDGDEIWKTVEW